MNLTTRIAFRHLRSKHSFGFISFSTVLSIIGLMLGIASLIIISCVSEGFSNAINSKLSGIDGHIRVNSYLTEEMGTNKIQEIDSILQQLPISIKYISPYIVKHTIIKKGSYTKGIIIYGVPEKALNEIFQLNQFSQINSKFHKENGIIILQFGIISMYDLIRGENMTIGADSGPSFLMPSFNIKLNQRK